MSPRHLSSLYLNCRHDEYVEDKVIVLPPELVEKFKVPPVSDETFVPTWDVAANESLFGNIPERGGTLGVWRLASVQLPRDRHVREIIVLATSACQKACELGDVVHELSTLFVWYKNKYNKHVPLLADKDAQISKLTQDAELSTSAINAANAELKKLTT